jgi:hypothetical protein
MLRRLKAAALAKAIENLTFEVRVFEVRVFGVRQKLAGETGS